MSEVVIKDAKRVAKLVFEHGRYRAMFNNRVLCSSSSKEYVINKIRGRDCNRAADLGIFDVEDEDHFIVDGAEGLVIEEEESVEFDINTRFEFLETLVKMIVNNTIPSLLITGEGGLGKTFTVKKVLLEAGLIDVASNQQKCRERDQAYDAALAEYDEQMKIYARQQARIAKGKDVDDEIDEPEAPIKPDGYGCGEGDFIFVKGYSTPKALYRILYENRNRKIIFDDCDSIQKDMTAVNLIKAAADSYEDRWVSWYSENPFGSDLPTSFKFEGQIIFISNMSYHRVDQAIRSRSMCVDLSMNVDQKIERMTRIVESAEFMPNATDEQKQDALDFLKDKRYAVRDLTLRSLISIVKIRQGGAANWKQLAEYIVRTN